uniref:Uncharacterized protein n=1 Tax=Trypanosoma congolense (strain IL3000) TaxID=1068625 RepID=G0UTM8_TRYCI|nr:conserved hypothetical protein [Trypanosoma congolense IL3000]
MAGKKTPRRPIDIDNDELIDFSAVGNSNVVKAAAPSLVLLRADDAGNADALSAEMAATSKAVDMRLNTFSQRKTPRRRIGFGCGSALEKAAPSNISTSFSVTEPTGMSSAGTAPQGTRNNIVDSESKRLLDALWREETARREEESKQVNLQLYEGQLRRLLQKGVTEGGECAAAGHRVYSMLDQFFADGVPDVEPWDMWALAIPRYNPSNVAVNTSLDCVYHPVLPHTHYSRFYLHAHDDQKTVFRLPKTKDELRVERQERLRKAKEERERAKKFSAQHGQLTVVESTAGSSAALIAGAPSRDRVSNRSLCYNLFTDSVLNPLGTDNKVFLQYQERFLQHQRRNHERHVAAIPRQIEKRKQDTKRHAEERPVFRAYHIYPIYGPAHLGKLRNFANDGLLRGFILWICRCHAIVVLTGGEVAVRHLERWMLEKMVWESADTKAVRLMTCPLQDAATFSFVKSKQQKRGRGLPGGEVEGGADGENEKPVHVYMSFVETVEEGEAFMCGMPTSGPWRDLSHVWRAAIMAVSASTVGA